MRHQREQCVWYIICLTRKAAAQKAVAPEPRQDGDLRRRVAVRRGDHRVAGHIQVAHIAPPARVVAQLGSPVVACVNARPQLIIAARRRQVRDVVLLGVGPPLLLQRIPRHRRPDRRQPTPPARAPVGQLLVVALLLIGGEDIRLLRLGRVLAQVVAQLEVVEVPAPLAVAGEQPAQALKPLAALVVLDADEGADRPCAQRVAGGQQQAEDGLEHGTPALTVGLQPLDAQREEVIGVVRDAGDQRLGGQGTRLRQLAGHQVEVERVLLHRRVEALGQGRVQRRHAPVGQHLREILPAQVGQPVLGMGLTQLQRLERIVGPGAEQEDDPRRRLQRQEAQVALAVQVFLDLVETVDDDNLLRARRGDLAQRLGEVVTQGRAAVRRDVDLAQPVLEDQPGQDIPHQADLMVGARLDGDKVVGRRVRAVLLKHPSDDAALALTGVAGHGDVVAGRPRRGHAGADLRQLALAAHKGFEAVGDKAGVVVNEGAQGRLAQGGMRRGGGGAGGGHVSAEVGEDIQPLTDARRRRGVIRQGLPQAVNQQIHRDSAIAQFRVWYRAGEQLVQHAGRQPHPVQLTGLLSRADGGDDHSQLFGVACGGLRVQPGAKLLQNGAEIERQVCVAKPQDIPSETAVQENEHPTGGRITVQMLVQPTQGQVARRLSDSPRRIKVACDEKGLVLAWPEGDRHSVAAEIDQQLRRGSRLVEQILDGLPQTACRRLFARKRLGDKTARRSLQHRRDGAGIRLGVGERRNRRLMCRAIHANHQGAAGRRGCGRGRVAHGRCSDLIGRRGRHLHGNRRSVGANVLRQPLGE